ncbi:MAG: putative Mg2+ transporter-C (MgtC) family protein [Modestobacter sp.]|jgi:putative Mg2+ transporter-C (MgtC) family protein|nr:putative Mg2+ transporter-C (MgtC) family protein [Modestobacter sp.]HEV7727268.1 MgtC/SapB family protein [Modestobacter sp.]
MTLLAAEPNGQTWVQVGELGLAFLLSALIGLEREIRQKSAGLRTLTIVGFASALFMLISKYGFSDVVGPDINLDPSRVAAQVVSGLGFIGGGLVFVRRDAVRGLTTAAVVWLTAAVGMAAGAGLPLLAGLVTAGHFVIVFFFTPLAHRLSRRLPGVHQVRLTYRDGEGVLRRALAVCTSRGFSVRELSTAAPGEDGGRRDGAAPGLRQVAVRLTVEGRGTATDLASWLADVDGVLAVTAGDVDEEAD